MNVYKEIYLRPYLIDHSINLPWLIFDDVNFMNHHRKLLEPEEVKLFLDAQGAENVIVLPLKSPLADITTFVIATGRSRKHMRKMSEAIFIAVSI